MFTFTCPKCKRRLGADNLRSGTTQQCSACHTRMRVLLAKEAANADALEQTQGRNDGPLVLGVSALAGILIGSAIFFRSSLWGSKPTPFILPLEVAAANETPPDKPMKAPPKGGGAAKGDDAPKPEPSVMTGDESYDELLRYLLKERCLPATAYRCGEGKDAKQAASLSKNPLHWSLLVLSLLVLL